MGHVKRDSSRWKQRWPWNHFFGSAINEVFCRSCCRPFQDGPEPEPEIVACKGSIALCAYPAGTFRPNAKVLRIGRLRAGIKRLYLSENIPTEEFDDLLAVIEEATMKLTAEKRTSSKRR